MPPLPLSSPAPAALRDAGLDAQRADRLTARLRHWVETRRISGMLLRIERRGRALDWTAGTRDGAGGPAFDVDTLVRLYSISKPITSALMFTLFEDGRWRFDDPLTRFLPELADLRLAASGQRPLREPVMRDLLLHQAGFAYGIGDTGEVDRLYESERVLDFNAPLETMLARVARLPLAGEPGTTRYSIAHDLLGLVAQRIADRPLDALMRERLFAPLGMRDAGFAVEPAQTHRLAELHGLDADGRAVPVNRDAAGPTRWKLTPAPALHSGGAGVIGTVDDLSCFLRLFAGPRSDIGRTVLSPATVRLMTSGTGVESSQRPGASMTPGWWTRIERPADSGSCACPGSLFTNGGGGSFAWIDPAQDLVVVGLLNVVGWQPGDLPTRIFDPLVYQSLIDD